MRELFAAVSWIRDGDFSMRVVMDARLEWGI